MSRKLLRTAKPRRSTSKKKTTGGSALNKIVVVNALIYFVRVVVEQTESADDVTVYKNAAQQAICDELHNKPLIPWIEANFKPSDITTLCSVVKLLQPGVDAVKALKSSSRSTVFLIKRLRAIFAAIDPVMPVAVPVKLSRSRIPAARGMSMASTDTLAAASTDEAGSMSSRSRADSQASLAEAQCTASAELDTVPEAAEGCDSDDETGMPAHWLEVPGVCGSDDPWSDSGLEADDFWSAVAAAQDDLPGAPSAKRGRVAADSVGAVARPQAAIRFGVDALVTEPGSADLAPGTDW